MKGDIDPDNLDDGDYGDDGFSYIQSQVSKFKFQIYFPFI